MHSHLSRALNIVWAVIYEDALLGTHTKLRKKQLVDFSFGLQVVTGVRDKAILQGRKHPGETVDNLMYFRRPVAQTQQTVALSFELAHPFIHPLRLSRKHISEMLVETIYRIGILGPLTLLTLYIVMERMKGAIYLVAKTMRQRLGKKLTCLLLAMKIIREIGDEIMLHEHAAKVENYVFIILLIVIICDGYEMVDKLDSRTWLLDITQLPFCKTTKKN